MRVPNRKTSYCGKDPEFVIELINLRCLLNILVEVSKRELDGCLESREDDYTGAKL